MPDSMKGMNRLIRFMFTLCETYMENNTERGIVLSFSLKE